MTQQIDIRKVAQLFEKYKAVTAYKNGFRLVIFFPEIEANKLIDFSIHQISDKSANPPRHIKGFGAVFDNPQDNCEQALILRDEDKNPIKGCLIVPLIGDKITAKASATQIIEAMPKEFNSAEDIQQAAKVASKITGDVYCSDLAWFEKNTDLLDGSKTNMQGHNFVKTKSNMVEVLFINGDIEFISEVAGTSQKSDNGMYVIKQNSGKDCFSYYGCHPKQFQELYCLMGEAGPQQITPEHFQPIKLSGDCATLA